MPSTVLEHMLAFCRSAGACACACGCTCYMRRYPSARTCNAPSRTRTRTSTQRARMFAHASCTCTLAHTRARWVGVSTRSSTRRRSLAHALLSLMQTACRGRCECDDKALEAILTLAPLFVEHAAGEEEFLGRGLGRWSDRGTTVEAVRAEIREDGCFPPVRRAWLQHSLLQIASLLMESAWWVPSCRPS